MKIPLSSGADTWHAADQDNDACVPIIANSTAREILQAFYTVAQHIEQVFHFMLNQKNKCKHTREEEWNNINIYIYIEDMWSCVVLCELIKTTTEWMKCAVAHIAHSAGLISSREYYSKFNSGWNIDVSCRIAIFNWQTVGSAMGAMCAVEQENMKKCLHRKLMSLSEHFSTIIIIQCSCCPTVMGFQY